MNFNEAYLKEYSSADVRLQYHDISFFFKLALSQKSKVLVPPIINGT